MNIKEWIEKNLIYSRGLISKKCKKEWFYKNGYGIWWNDIFKKTSFLNQYNPTFSQRVWHIIDKMDLVKCGNPSCNNLPMFFSFTKGYLKTCSNRCAQLNPITINKIKTTNLKKYGTEYSLSNKNIIEKKNKTVNERYGVNNISQAVGISEKKEKTCLKNYGVKWILSDQKRKEMAIFKKYGVDNILKLKSIQIKVSTTRRGNFYDWLLSSNRLKSVVIPLFTKEEYLSKGYYEDYKFKCCECKNEFLDCLEDGDLPRCNVCYKGKSDFEKRVVDFIKTICFDEIMENDKIVLNGKELDIYIPSKKIAIECDGLYWHGEINGTKNKTYHLDKTIECEKKGIRLIHIFEDEWINKQDIVKSILCNIFKTDGKIYARNCIIKELQAKECNIFLKNNHLQGYDLTANIRIGLFNKDKLVSVMTYGNLRLSLGNKKTNNNEYEMRRYCNIINTSVIGGASKLLAHFIKIYKPSKIISYADKRWFIGGLYEKLKFIKVSNGNPNYWYFGKDKHYKRYHRFSFAKHTQQKKLKIFDVNLSEWKNMQNNGWDRIWDCGHLKYEYIVT